MFPEKSGITYFMLSTTAFAYVDESAATETEPVMEETTQEVEEEPMGGADTGRQFDIG